MRHSLHMGELVRRDLGVGRVGPYVCRVGCINALCQHIVSVFTIAAQASRSNTTRPEHDPDTTTNTPHRPNTLHLSKKPHQFNQLTDQTTRQTSTLHHHHHHHPKNANPTPNPPLPPPTHLHRNRRHLRNRLPNRPATLPHLRTHLHLRAVPPKGPGHHLPHPHNPSFRQALRPRARPHPLIHRR